MKSNISSLVSPPVIFERFHRLITSTRKTKMAFIIPTKEAMPGLTNCSGCNAAYLIIFKPLRISVSNLKWNSRAHMNLTRMIVLSSSSASCGNPASPSSLSALSDKKSYSSSQETKPWQNAHRKAVKVTSILVIAVGRLSGGISSIGNLSNCS